MLTASPGVCFRAGKFDKVAAISIDLFLLWFLISLYMWNPPRKGPGPSSPSISEQTTQQPRGLLRVTACLLFTDPSQGHQSHPDAFFFALFWDLSCTYVYIRDLLPVSSWFSVRIVPYLDVFFMCLWREGNTSSCSTPLPWSLSLFERLLIAGLYKSIPYKNRDTRLSSNLRIQF